MIVSVIIVNYRVRYFLELCLFSVQRALAGIGPSEVIVVDNASADGSIEALRPLFPWVRFIVNSENVGFARANNQALSLAGGEYILFLNPDTVLPEDFAQKCLGFMRETRDMGALGARMIDGGGRFLPESRRGFPKPWVAFCKLSGLSSLFPRSRFFAEYYLGHLRADKAHPAPVLSGACMLVRRAILGEVGGFDERFFMYAEDIDLSYRIGKAGYVNYYFPGTTIIHFKGESTQKDIRYIRLFYKAMSQFRRKHFNQGLSVMWNWGMEAAIWLRAGLGGLGRVLTRRSDGRRAAGDDGSWAPPTSKDLDNTGESPANTGESPANVGAGSRANRRLLVTGDAAEAARVKGLLGEGWAFVSMPEEASAVLLCEGPDFSFRNCITALEESRQRKVLIHAAGSRCAVGSADRDGHGETLVF